MRTRGRTGGRVQGVVGRVALALAVGLAGVVAGLGPVGTAPVAADCGMQFPPTHIGPHRGFAFDGTIRSIERLPAQFLERITMDVSEMLAGTPVEEVVFDLGRGDCSFLQADRYKVGDRLIVTAAGPPADAEERHLPQALTWRYEWGDTWSLHGLPPQHVRRFSPAIRAADSHDEIVALVAPEALPYGLDPGAWSVTLRGPDSGIRLGDVVRFDGRFAALGTREAPRGQRRTDPDRPVLFLSETGRSWAQVLDPFPAVRGPQAYLVRLAVFQDALYAIGRDGGSLIVFSSPDGRTWTNVLTQPANDADVGSGGAESRYLTYLMAAATADTLVVMGGPAGMTSAEQLRAWTTDNGVTWTRETPVGLDEASENLIATGEGFAIRSCICNAQTPRWLIKTSEDGVSWSQAGEAPSDTVDLAWDPETGRYLAALALADHFDGSHAALEASTDGITWTRLVTSPGRTGVPLDVATGGGGILLLGADWDESAWALTSADGGGRWVRTELPGTASGDCVASGAVTVSSMVAVGDCRGSLAWAGALPESGGAAP